MDSEVGVLIGSNSGVRRCVFLFQWYPNSLKLTAKAPENGWLEYSFLFGKGVFSGAMFVSGGTNSLKRNGLPKIYIFFQPFFFLGGVRSCSFLD